MVCSYGTGIREALASRMEGDPENDPIEIDLIFLLLSSINCAKPTI
jgi:hypothetical protein